MANKVILISIDGMRPDGFLQCGNACIEEIMNRAYYSLDVQTVSPSITLPCHLSLFHSVPPTRHGIITNTYTPFVRPLDGLFEVLSKNKKSCAMYYGWGPMRDVARPESIRYSEFIEAYSEESSDTSLTVKALERINKSHPDFVFLYMVETDEKGGHDNGWMSDEYLHRISIALDNAFKVIEECEEEYNIIITADHGGHDRAHGTDLSEDKTIPNFFIGKDFPKGVKFSGGSILNIAPTIAKIMGVEPDAAWEGTEII